MQKIENKYVRISDITGLLYCPRALYFRLRRVSDPGIKPAEIRAEMFRLISSHLPDVLQTTDIENVRNAIDSACDDASVIYDRYPDIISNVRTEAYERIEDIASGLKNECEKNGRESVMSILIPRFERIMVFSDRLSISGVIDKVSNIDGKLIPVVVSASSPPDNGIYGPDRVRLAAYALLLSERCGEEIGQGAVEYVRGWTIRYTDIKNNDIRAVISARNKVKKIREGHMPSENTGKKCANCEYSSSCKVKVSFLDSLFKNL
ncbi:recombinase RecB [Methanocella sp. CWC-04]|uniref:Recombinase RecB n=1 Tax=Methanooceanicella nereidis TaxID=2052831 RepID=A0AAP2R9W5_9EURY|nr:Dna2/Cas4 domain-containing protein [Methanocella sp. CWC-04]MCD1293598.1 recombinase RecB [Methanocella sp. CWC-04]